MAARTVIGARQAAVGVGAAVVVALLLRLIGLGYGLPAVYNPDEVAIMNRALGLAQNGLNPRNFLYPSLYFYVLFAWEGLLFVVGWLGGAYDSLAAFETSYFLDPSRLYLAGRLLSALLGAATVWAVYLVGRRVSGRTAGLIAALVLAVAPLAVRDSHYVKHDIPVTLLIVLTHLVVAGDLLDPRGRRRPLLAGACAGLAMSTHYYALFVAVPVAVAALTPRHGGEPVGARARRLLLAGAATVVTFGLTSPFLVADPVTAWRDIVANRAIVVDRATGSAGVFGSLGFYGQWLFRDAMGLGSLLLAVAGLVVTARRGWRSLVVLTSFPVVFLLFIANTVPASRYLNPLLPFLALTAGVAVSSMVARGAVGRMAAAGLLTVATLEATVASLTVDRFFRQTDTRTMAEAWIHAHVPEGASILVQPYSVPLRPSREALVEALTARLGSPDRASVRFARQLALDPYPAPAYRTIYLGDGGEDVDKTYISPGAFDGGHLAPLTDHGVTWVVLKRYNTEDPATAALDAALVRDARLVARFDPYVAGLPPDDRRDVAPFLHNTDGRITAGLERPGPIIEIWMIPT